MVAEEGFPAPVRVPIVKAETKRVIRIIRDSRMVVGEGFEPSNS